MPVYPIARVRSVIWLFGVVSVRLFGFEASCPIGYMAFRRRNRSVIERFGLVSVRYRGFHFFASAFRHWTFRTDTVSPFSCFFKESMPTTHHVYRENITFAFRILSTLSAALCIQSPLNMPIVINRVYTFFKLLRMRWLPKARICLRSLTSYQRVSVYF